MRLASHINSLFCKLSKKLTSNDHQDVIALRFLVANCFGTNDDNTRDALLSLYKTRSTDTTIRYELFKQRNDVWRSSRRVIYTAPNYFVHHILVNANKHAKFNFYFAFQQHLTSDRAHWKTMLGGNRTCLARHQLLLLDDFVNHYLTLVAYRVGVNSNELFIKIAIHLLAKWSEYLTLMFREF